MSYGAVIDNVTILSQVTVGSVNSISAFQAPSGTCTSTPLTSISYIIGTPFQLCVKNTGNTQTTYYLVHTTATPPGSSVIFANCIPQAPATCTGGLPTGVTATWTESAPTLPPGETSIITITLTDSGTAAAGPYTFDTEITAFSTPSG